MIKKLWVVILALVVAATWTGVSYAEQSQQQPGQTSQQPGTTTGAQPGQTGQQQQQPGGAMEGKTVMGTVRDVDPSKKTISLELTEPYGGKQKGERMTFNLSDQAKWEGTQWKSLSDLKPGDQVRVQVKESAGKHEILAFQSPTGGGAATGAGAPTTQPGTQQQQQQR